MRPDLIKINQHQADAIQADAELKRMQNYAQDLETIMSEEMDASGKEIKH